MHGFIAELPNASVLAQLYATPTLLLAYAARRYISGNQQIVKTITTMATVTVTRRSINRAALLRLRTEVFSVSVSRLQTLIMIKVLQEMMIR